MRPVVMLASAFAAVVAATGAQAAVVDFEDAPVGGLPSTITSRGLTFTAAEGAVGVQNGAQCNPQCAQNGTATLLFGAPTNTVPQSFNPLTMNAPAAFQLLGLDYAEFNGFSDANTLRVTGSLVAGGTVSRLLTLDGVIDGAGGRPDFQTVAFDDAFSSQLFNSVTFTGLTSSFAPGGFALDNIRVNVSGAVPEPASWMMMLGGFGLAGGLLRSRRKPVVRFG